MPLKIVTWNINGIRAVKSKSPKQLLDSLQADIICLQETKVTRDMLDEPTAIVDGYDSFFSFSRKRTGYSGTATYCSCTVSPLKAEEGLTGRLSAAYDDIVRFYGNTFNYTSADLDALDAEGRCIITQHQVRLSGGEIKDIVLVNVYVPRAGDKEDRLWYKLKFLNLLQSRAEELLKQNIHVIIVGDMNLAHKDIDNCNPECNSDCNVRTSRVWMNKFLRVSERDTSLPESDDSLAKVTLSDLKGGMFSDVYRLLHPDQQNAFTNWTSSTDARKTNYGRRLDYILIDTDLAKHVSGCEIMNEVEGSDHCPVVVTLNCDPVPSAACPQICSKYMPEFKGQQQKLFSFFTKSDRQCKNQHLSYSTTSGKDLLDNKSSLAESTLGSGSSPVFHPECKKVAKQQISRPHEKRNATGSVKHNSKKLKLHNEPPSKQSNLTSFFRTANSIEKKIMGNSVQTGVVGKSAAKSTYSVDCDSEVDIVSAYTTTSDSFGALSSSDSGVGMAHSQESQSPSRSQNSCHSESYLSDDSEKCNLLTSDSEASKSTVAGFIDTRTAPSNGSSQVWKSLLSGPPPAPLCPGHKEPCILKTVNKKGPNKNKKFYVCARPEGAAGNPEYRCNYFVWYKAKKN